MENGDETLERLYQVIVSDSRPKEGGNLPPSLDLGQLRPASSHIREVPLGFTESV